MRHVKFVVKQAQKNPDGTRVGVGVTESHYRIPDHASIRGAIEQFKQFGQLRGMGAEIVFDAAGRAEEASTSVILDYVKSTDPVPELV